MVQWLFKLIGETIQRELDQNEKEITNSEEVRDISNHIKVIEDSQPTTSQKVNNIYNCIEI